MSVIENTGSRSGSGVDSSCDLHWACSLATDKAIVQMRPLFSRKPKRRISEVIVELSDAIVEASAMLSDDNKAILRLINRYPRFAKIRRLDAWEQRMIKLLDKEDATTNDLVEILEAVSDFGTSDLYTQFSSDHATELYNCVSMKLHQLGWRQHVEYTITRY